MGGKIDAYLDCVSPYSWYALLYLTKNREILAQYDVEVEFHPVFLGGINVGSGNKPPWTLPAKAAYGKFDGKRAQQYFGVPIEVPSFFPILSLLPQRAMIYVKETFPRDRFEASFSQLWKAMWQQGMDLSKPDLMGKCLSEHFSEDEVKDILAGASNPEYKQKLLDYTKVALDKGAFGCPWFWVRNSEGTEEPFFGSDRFTYMLSFLGIPFQDVTIKPRSNL